MTIHGYGFTEGFKSFFNDIECKIIRIESTMILCKAPKSTSSVSIATLLSC